MDLTLNKRYSDKWQFNVAVTLQKRNDYDVYYTNPTGVDLYDGLNTGPRVFAGAAAACSRKWH